MQVQYPDALQTMITDLRSIRNWAGFLQKTEIKFDMLSAVDELAKQVRQLCKLHSVHWHCTFPCAMGYMRLMFHVECLASNINDLELQISADVPRVGVECSI